MRTIYKVIIFAVVSGLLLGAFLGGYKYFFSAQSKSNIKLNLTEKISTANPTIVNSKLPSTYTQQQGVETGTMYKNINTEIAGYKKDLELSSPNTSVTLTKRMYLYRALGSYGVGVNSVDGGQTEMRESLEGHYSLYKAFPSIFVKEKINLLAQRVVMSGLLKSLYEVYTESPLNTIYADTSWAQESAYKTFLLKSKSNQDLAFRLFFNEIFSKYIVNDDRLLQSIKIQNLAKILTNHSNLLTSVDTKYFVNLLAEDLKKYNDAVETIYFKNNKDNKELNPLINYVFALDVLSQFDKTAKAEDVKKSYRELLLLLKKTMTGKEGIVKFKELNTKINYLVYLYRTDGGKFNSEMLELVADIKKFPVDNMDNKYFIGFFKDKIVDKAKNDKIFIEISKANKDVSLLVETYGRP